MSIVYLEVSPDNKVTHIRCKDETFPRPVPWSLADIYTYATRRGARYVVTHQKTTDGGILRSVPLHINDWVLYYNLEQMGVQHDA